MEQKSRFSPAFLRAFFVLSFFLLGRNCRLAFLKGKAEEIYADISAVFSLGIFLYFFYDRIFRQEFKGKLRSRIQADGALCAYFALLIFILIRNCFSKDPQIHLILSFNYPIAAFGCLIALTASKYEKEFLQAYTGYGLVLMAVNLVEGLLFRDLSGIYTAKEFFLGPRNQFPMFSCVAVAAACTLKAEEPQKYRWLKPVMTALLLLNSLIMRSATSLICNTLLCMIMFVPAWKRAAEKRNLSAAGLGIYGLGWLSIVIFRVQNYLSGLIELVLHRDATMTFRTSLWNRALRQIKYQPFFGYGVPEDPDIFIDVYKGYLYYYSTHNEVLELLYEGGITLVLGYAAVFLLSFRKKRNSWYFLMCAFVAMVNGLTEATGMFVVLILGFMAFYFTTDIFPEKNS